MLASLKPISWTLYAPCGIPGEFRPLRPVSPEAWAAAQQQLAAQAHAPPCPTPTPTQHQGHLCPEMLSLQSCRAAAKTMQWGKAAGGMGQRAYDAWRTSSGGGVGRLAEAGEGPGPWYLPYEDKLMGVFEWDTAEAPLVVQPGG